MQPVKKVTMRVVHIALGVYLLSMALPAIRENDTVIIGFMAAYFSVFGIPGTILHVLINAQATAILLGGLANGLFVFTYFALLLRRYSRIPRPSYTTCARTALAAFVIAVGSIIPLLFVTETHTTVLGIDSVTETTYRISVGFYVWAGSAALLAYHLHRETASAKIESVAPVEESSN